MDHIEAPMYCDQPFTQKWPMPPALKCMDCCFCCMISCCMVPKVRGIPRSSQPLPAHETAELLKNLQGNWKIQPLSAGGSNQVIYTDVFVRDDVMILSGGTHNRTVHNHNGGGSHKVTVANQTQQQTFHFFRGSSGEIYCDYTGSLLVKLDFEGGEVELDNSIGHKLLLQRGWKRDGLAPPQQGMMGVVHVVQATVMQ